MKKILFILSLLTISTSAFSQTNLYVNPDFEEIAKDHKIIAIIPFKTQVKLRPKQMKNMTAESIKQLEQSEGESVQAAMYSWFLKRKKRGKLSNIEIQDSRKTNALLKKQGIDYNNVYDFTSEELAKILQVDAIIMGDFETSKPMSDGASIALGLVFGVFGNTNSATLNMSVYNGKDGTLLWNYNKNVRGNLGSNSEDLINILMRKASRRLAYTKNS